MSPPPRRGYMRSSLQRSRYLERQSGEGGTPVALNALALTYHFGQATSTPDGTKAVVQKITCDVHTGGFEAMSAHTPLEAGPRRKHGVLSPTRSRTSGITGRPPQTAVEDNFAERDGADNSISEASTSPNFGDVRRVYSKKRDGADNIISEASTTTSFGEVRGVYYKKKIETSPKWRKPLHFFPDKTKKLKLLPTEAESRAKY